MHEEFHLHLTLQPSRAIHSYAEGPELQKRALINSQMILRVPVQWKNHRSSKREDRPVFHRNSFTILVLLLRLWVGLYPSSQMYSNFAAILDVVFFKYK